MRPVESSDYDVSDDGAHCEMIPWLKRLPYRRLIRFNYVPTIALLRTNRFVKESAE